MIKSAIDGYNNSLARVKEDAKRLSGEIESYKDQLATLEKEEALAGDAPTKKAQELLVQLSKHAGVEEVKMNKQSLCITTPLLFTNIRTNSGSRSFHRACIGAFSIHLTLNPLRITVANEVFLEHWAVRGKQPCLGEYSDDIYAALDTGDYYRVIDTLFHFLRSTNDAAAYQSSHQWLRENRRINTYGRYVEPGREIAHLKKGTKVVCISEKGYESARGIFGYVGELLSDSASDGSAHVSFRKFIDGHPGCTSSSPHCWNIPTHLLHVISEEAYASTDQYAVKVSKPLAVVDRLDQLPDGSTFEDFIRVQEEMKSFIPEAVIGKAKVSRAKKAVASTTEADLEKALRTLTHLTY